MPRKPTGKPTGRPEGSLSININWEQFDKLCQMQATLTEIAGWFECSEDTIEARVKERTGMLFSEYFKRTSAGGKISLRRKQFETALSGNVSMQIWLGKQYLGQTDRLDTTNKNDTNVSGSLDVKITGMEII